MYCGKMTAELEELYNEYEKRFGVEPDYYEEIDYGDDYEGYKDDISKSLESGVQLSELYA